MTNNAGEQRGALHGAIILIVEDNTLIALDSQDTLVDAGAADVYLAVTAAQVANLLANGRKFDAAVLDIHLGEESGFPIAEMLTRAAIPIIFASGFSGDRMIPPEFLAVRTLAKPYLPQDLVTALESVLAARGV